MIINSPSIAATSLQSNSVIKLPNQQQQQSETAQSQVIKTEESIYALDKKYIKIN
jgi:hypothetical protein